MSPLRRTVSECGLPRDQDTALRRVLSATEPSDCQAALWFGDCDSPTYVHGAPLERVKTPESRSSSRASDEVLTVPLKVSSETGVLKRISLYFKALYA